MSERGFRRPKRKLDWAAVRLVASPFESRALCLSLLCLVVITSSGCDSGDGRVPVEGTVTFKGQALKNATITFFPQQGAPVIAPLDDAGGYSVQLVPGEYKVTVITGPIAPTDYKEGDPLPPPAVVLPDRYSSRLRTQLTATVDESLSEPVIFELK